MPRGKKNASAEVETSAAEPVPVYAVPAEPPAAGPPGEPGVLAPSDGEELEALRRRVAELEAAARQTPADGVVELTFLAAVSQDNVCALGEYGSLNGVGGCIEVPRKEFGGKFLTPVVRSLLKDRSLIVCAGLTAEERRRYGVDYREGELLDLAAFDRLLDLDPATLTTLFDKLCPEHKEFAATRFITAYENGDNRVSREKVEALNDLSKTVDPRGLFKPILAGLNKV